MIVRKKNVYKKNEKKVGKKKKKKWNVEGRHCICPKHSHLCAPHLWGTTGKWESSPTQQPPGLPNRCSTQTIKLLHKYRPTNERRQADSDKTSVLLTYTYIVIDQCTKHIWLLKCIKLRIILKGCTKQVRLKWQHIYYNSSSSFWPNLSQKC